MRFTLLAVLFSLPACVALPKNSAVFYDSKAEELLKTCSRSAPENVVGFWIPSVGDIRELESRFDMCLSQRALKPLSVYIRQYAGIRRVNERVIYLNAFLPDSDPITNDQPVAICDGSESTFGVEYEVETGRFKSFEYNGPGDDDTDSPVQYRCK